MTNKIKLIHVFLLVVVMLGLPIATSISKVHRGAQCGVPASKIQSMAQLEELRKICR